MKIFSSTDTGKQRSTNQDAYYSGFLFDNSAFVVVCDGMGGANAGNIASETAVKVISDYVNNSYSNKMDRYSLSNMLKSAVVSANMNVFEKSQNDPDLIGMGTTAVVLVVRNGLAIICHVGDSRVYLVNDEVTQITRDHSVVQTLVESGELTPDEAKNHPRKNIITRALGVEETVFPDCMEIPVKIGDTVLVCTDGLSNFIEIDKIKSIFEENDIENVTQNLINTANENGGGDNITAVTVTL